MPKCAPLLLRLFPAQPLPPLKRCPSSPAGLPPVLLLHGTVDSPGAWAVLADALTSRGRIVFVPAYGNRGTDAVENSVAEVEEYARGLLSSSRAERLDIIGHSQGGLIAYLLALRGFPLRRVVSVSGSIGGSCTEGPLTPILRVLSWRRGTLARLLAGEAMTQQIARTGLTAPDPYDGPTPLPSPPSWVNLISGNDGVVKHWNPQAEQLLPDARTICLEERTGGRGARHWEQQADPEVVRIAVEEIMRA
ncbi:hypothetical protein CLAC_10605 [Corynebacterium lactis RW2-5]|uniref:AB hydrolase-1 domain-containing protein n=1 Tax=Corynebacterium lactis RW2-5 TaxID=1408189 RepID=A0A0K2H1X2_9CORY|nr:hypothetical protein CLAC_10605 [Corynebacterium lactis RW2-5]